MKFTARVLCLVILFTASQSALASQRSKNKSKQSKQNKQQSSAQKETPKVTPPAPANTPAQSPANLTITTSSALSSSSSSSSSSSTTLSLQPAVTPHLAPVEDQFPPVSLPLDRPKSNSPTFSRMTREDSTSSATSQSDNQTPKTERKLSTPKPIPYQTTATPSLPVTESQGPVARTQPGVVAGITNWFASKIYEERTLVEPTIKHGNFCSEFPTEIERIEKMNRTLIGLVAASQTHKEKGYVFRMLRAINYARTNNIQVLQTTRRDVRIVVEASLREHQELILALDSLEAQTPHISLPKTTKPRSGSFGQDDQGDGSDEDEADSLGAAGSYNTDE